MRPEAKSGASWIASAPPQVQDEFLSDLTEGELRALPYLFDFWAFDHQLPPPGDWRSWVILGGRGAGKTRAGAEWVRSQVEGSMPLDEGRARRVALVGETYDQVRDVMIFGDSGILACSPADRAPTFEASRRRLVWPNGAVATLHSANDPDALRGPQFDAAWVDELAKWPNGQDTWDMLQFALRLGDHPRACVTTTPQNVDVLKRLLASPSTVQTHAKTEVNAANLAASFLQEVRDRYAGSRLAQQELDGVLLDDVDGALWKTATLEKCRIVEVPQLDRIVVAVDPSVSRTGDACGIVVAGATYGPNIGDWKAYVLADCTVEKSSTKEWAEAAIKAVDGFGADCIVVEVNQGGQLVEDLLRQYDSKTRIESVHAKKGKAARAEPVGLLYEQGRVFHAGVFNDLESQLAQFTPQGFKGSGSPDRADALVWAITALIVDPKERAQPSARLL